MTVVDFSFARYTVAQLKEAGITAVIRYLTGAGKAISAIELAADLMGGEQVVLVFENTATDASGGFNVGVAYANQANAALIALGLPISTPVYFAADTDYPNASAALPYYQGIASVRPGPTNGCYGEATLIDLCFSDGLIGFGWESESSSFPGNATLDPNVALWQRVNGAPLSGTDLDLVERADFGQLPRPKQQEVPVQLNFKVAGNVADVLAAPGGGAWILDTTGAVYTVHTFDGGPTPLYHGGANGKAYFVGRTAAKLTPYGNGYTITATSGETYNYP